MCPLRGALLATWGLLLRIFMHFLEWPCWAGFKSRAPGRDPLGATESIAQRKQESRRMLKKMYDFRGGIKYDLRGRGQMVRLEGGQMVRLDPPLKSSIPEPDPERWSGPGENEIQGRSGYHQGEIFRL